MKITKKQREKIIKEAIIILKRDKLGMCWALTRAIYPKWQHMSAMRIIKIQKYFPLFNRETAVKYFGARDIGVWWFLSTKQNIRIKFFRYLLNGKLPKIGR